MNTAWNSLKAQVNQNPMISFLALASIGLAMTAIIRRPSGKFADADQKLKELLAEEDAQTRPFPKEIDLEPAFE
jgi:hypothetical protein